MPRRSVSTCRGFSTHSTPAPRPHGVPEIVAERVATLTRLLEPPARPRILLTTVNALAQKVPPPATFQDATMTLRTGGRVQPEALTAFLEANGYHRTMPCPFSSSARPS